MTTEPSTRFTRMCHVFKLNRSSFYKGSEPVKTQFKDVF